MSSTGTGKRSTTPKKQRSRSQLQQKERIQEDVCVRTSLPPCVEGPVYAILICHIPKLRWLPKHQSVCRSITIKVAWWGEDDTSAIFKPQISGVSLDHRQQPSTTAKYYIRSELIQFSKYLIDAAELVLKVYDTDTNRMIGTVKVKNLSTLSINNPIKGYLPIFSNKGDKLGELFIALRLLLLGMHDSNENLIAMSYTSDVSNPPSRRNSIGANDYNQGGQLENGLRTYTINRADNTEHLNSVHSNDTTALQQYDSTTPFQARTTNVKNVPPGMQAYKELPTGKVIEELIERANRLRENMSKPSLQKTTTIKKNNHSIEPTLFNNNNNNNAEIHGHKSFEMLIDDIDPSIIDDENIYDMIGIKSTVNLNDSNHSILTDLDGLENEQSLLDDLLYGGSTENNHNNKNKTYNTNSTNLNNKNRPHGKPPTGRSRSPSLSRVSGLSNRSRSTARSRSLTRSNDSDIASHVSFDMSNSDVDDSGNESHDDNELSTERIQLLNYVRTARIRIDHLRLNILNGRESPSHSSFGRTNKSKRAMNYYIEYQFPVIANNRDGHANEVTEVIKIVSKRFESNNDIIFSHLSTYPCLFNETIFKNWWRSLLIFKIYSRMSGTTNPEQIGFAVLPLRNIFKADYLHLEQDLNVIDRTQMNHNQKIPNKIAKKFCIGQLHLMLELDSDKKDFKTELDRIQLMEQMEPKNKQIIKSKRIKKSKKSIINSNNNLQLPKSFISNESSSSELTDGLVVQLYLSIVEARNIPQISNNNNLPRNPYFICRAFWNEEPVTSVVCWGSSTPRFNFQQKIPILLTKSTIEKMHQNFVIIELWDKKISGPSDQIIGIIKIPLEQFYVSFKDKQISRVLLRAQYPVISIDSWLPIIDPFISTNKSSGEIQVLLAMGTSDQITAVQVAHAGGDLFPSLTNKKLSTISNNNNNNNNNQSLSLVEHHFEIMIESINGLRAFESMVWGESDCFIQYIFPIQHEQQQLTNINSIKPFQLRTIRTATTLCTSDPTFQDTNKFHYILSPADALHKYFYAACQSTTPIEASIPFEVWSRFYYPNIRDQLLAKGKLPAAKLCSMTTMLNSDVEDKSMQSFRIPLEIVRDDPKHEQHHYTPTPTYGGDLLLTITYKRNIIQQNEPQVIPGHLSNDNSNVCMSVGIIRACGLKQAAMFQARHDARFNYPSQVGLNTYAKVTLSFLSDMESRSTKTIARSFVPDFNQSMDFPIPLIWSDHRNKSISLVEILEHGELKIDIYHQMNSNSNEKQSLDIHLCYCIISLKELIIRHTGIKGWYPLASANSVVTSEISSDPIENCVGGIELFIRFTQQDDRRRMMDSAKKLGWLNENYSDEENFLDDQKDLGCIVKLSIDRIQFPVQLTTQTDKDSLSIFAQYRFYDKMPIITKRKKAIIDRNNFICELQFNKEHLFLCSEPFLWYLREEKLEIQIWTSENDTYDYSQSLASTTDKLIGSIYVDLNTLCHRKRKSHRLSTILPIFKQGTKDLTGACVQIHVSIDKSKDFNELRNRNDLDTSNDIELDSYLENRHLNLISNDRALRTMTNNIFSVLVNIEQATHLPNIYSQNENIHTPPNPYVTYSTADSNHLCRTQVLTSTIKPQWNYQQSIKLSIEHLFNEKKVFLLKVWHKINADIESIPEKSGDKVLGFVSIDLSPLLSGLQQISGWYNIIDTIGNVQGQLKINIIPQQDLFEFKRMKYNSKQYQPKLDTHRSTSTRTENISSLNLNDLSSRSSNVGSTNLNSSIIDDENNKQSFLMNNLRRQLGELDVITERLKARYYSNSEISSTITTSRNSSVSSVPQLISLNLPLTTNSIHQNTDNTHSTTTIQKNLLEQFPESLSGKPLMSNGLNVTDVLSLHNDQVRLAQELMTKANHLLESSKDFFDKPPTVPIPPPISSTIIEKKSITSSPPALPNFNATNEFQTTNNSSKIDTTHRHINNSFEQQHLNDSIIWSDEENDEHDQSFLPIGLPPIHHRSIIPTVVSSPLHVEENSTHQEQQDDIDIVHIRPLNNLSAFNFDCQQMNAERLNGSLTNGAYTELSRHTVHASDITTTNNNQNEYKKPSHEVINSSDYQSPEQQSSSSDTSIVDDTNTQMKRIDVSIRKKTLPNFFPSNHEMEVSIKQVSQALTTSATNPSSNNLIKTINERFHSKLPMEITNTKRIEQIFQTKYPSN
ncbi:unnamed protein product [Rotaria sordida]|uniref:C2 domain-containing protein n=1 Tax=Rotaria sordida TaxID=392033 RepID=A0A814VM15_9BILA|nr:unnamed protein product [Rotaria sordida]CAF3869896.1 unnamed protein product [Rotaria sordida]